MTVGDLINGYSNEEVWMKEMKEYESIMRELACPWFPVAGNHDIYWRGKDKSQKPEGEMETAYELHIGPWHPDSSSSKAHAMSTGGVTIESL